MVSVSTDSVRAVRSAIEELDDTTPVRAILASVVNAVEQSKTVELHALAPRLMAYAKPILDRGAIGLFHKGADTDAELAAANSALIGGAYQADVLESLSDPRGRIIRVSRVK